MASQKNKESEFDKDYIFNLLMPSDSTVSTANPLVDDLSVNISDVIPRGEEPTEHDDDDKSSLSVLKSKLFMVEEEPILKKNLVLVNLMEYLVSERLDSALRKFNCCRCDKCKKDVAMLALNSLPSNYVLADPDDVRSLLDTSPTKEVNTALIRAILKIKVNPKH